MFLCYVKFAWCDCAGLTTFGGLRVAFGVWFIGLLFGMVFAV